MSLLTDLKAYWKLDEESGTRYDSTDNDYDLTDVNTVTSEDGKIGKSAVFTRANSERFDLSSFINPLTQVTWSFWTKGFFADREVFFSKSDTWVTGTGYWIFNEGGLKMGLSSYNVTSLGVASSKYNDGNWHHIVIVFDSTGAENIKVYVDGNLESTIANTTDIKTNTAVFKVGARGNNTDYLNASMDEIGIWDRPLTSTEVTSLYNSGSGLTYPFTTAVTPSGSLSLLGCGM